MVMVLAPLRGKAEARREQGAGGHASRERIDTTKAKPVTTGRRYACRVEGTGFRRVGNRVVTLGWARASTVRWVLRSSPGAGSEAPRWGASPGPGADVSRTQPPFCYRHCGGDEWGERQLCRSRRPTPGAKKRFKLTGSGLSASGRTVVTTWSTSPLV